MNPGSSKLRGPAFFIDGKYLVREIVLEQRFVVTIFEQVLECASLRRAAIRLLNDRPGGNFGRHRRLAPAGWNGTDDQRRVAASPRHAAVHVIHSEAVDFF